MTTETPGDPEMVQDRAKKRVDILVRYPSVSGGSLGKLFGRLYELLPWPKVNGIKLSYILFVLPTSLLPALLYFRLKVWGDKYVLTNQSVQRRKALTNRLGAEIPLEQVAEITVRQNPGQQFYKAGDVELRSRDGRVAMVLEGVVRPEVFRRNILEARDACLEVGASLETIAARQAE